MWLLVLNAKAGKRAGLSRLRKFEDICVRNQFPFQVINEPDQDATAASVEAILLAQPVSIIIAFGGDGLVSLCLQAVAEKQTGLMVVPAGTGNDFARSIGVLKKSEQEIFDFITHNKVKQIDAALVKSQSGQKWYLQILSTGFDANVNAQANLISWPKGRARYTVAMLIVLRKFKPIQYEISYNNEKVIVSAMLVLVANGVTYGGGMRISPVSSFEDGVLDLLYIEPVSKLTLLLIFPRVFFGSHLKHPKVKLLQSDEFTLQAQTQGYADGEMIGDLPMNVRVYPRAINTWVMA